MQKGKERSLVQVPARLALWETKCTKCFTITDGDTKECETTIAVVT